METPEVTTTPPAEGGAAEAASQGSNESAQAPAQSQDTGQSQVETPAPQASSNGNGTRSSDASFQRKVFKTLQAMQQRLDALGQPPAPPSQPKANGFDPNEFFTQPDVFLNRLLDERDKKLKEGLTQEQAAKQLESSRQEARKMIDSHEAIKRDPEGIEKIQEILQDETYELDEISLKYPVQAAKLALTIYEAQNQASRPATNSRKGALVSTASGVQTGRQANVITEYAKLRDELAANPSLARDPEFNKRKDALDAQLRQSQGRS